MLTCVPTQMGSQVGRFAVDFVASGNVADVLAFTICVTFTFGAVWTCTCNTFQTWFDIRSIVDIDVNVNGGLILCHCGLRNACGLGGCGRWWCGWCWGCNSG